MDLLRSASLFPADRYVRDLPEDLRFEVSRDIFRDPDIFDREIKNIFESTWVFLGLTSQLPRPNDFITTWIGRQPVVVSRDAEGGLHCFLNSCRHRASLVCHTPSGNAKRHMCPYHGWTYDSAGRCFHIKDARGDAYTADFKAEDHDLVRVARFGEYRGFMFASLEGDVPSLESHMGGMARFIDLIVDQSPDGIEIVPGVGLFTYRGNWKLQIENCLDAYHFTTTHKSLTSIVGRRRSGDSDNRLIPTSDFARMTESQSGSFNFAHGHAVLWSKPMTASEHLLTDRLPEIRQRIGEARANWMTRLRNASFFPNMQLADNGAMQLRIIRPLAVDLTEMRTYCIAPVGEAPQTRARRIRLYEDFFNSTGLATSDDTQVYEDCQAGHRAYKINDLQGYDRGIGALQPGADDFARELGVAPVNSLNGPFDLQDETVFFAAYREWARLMGRGTAVSEAAGRIGA